jgi:hypothetical protein
VNLLKNVLVVGILLAVAGGVYIAITGNPPTKPPPGAEEGWSGEPKIEMGTMGGPTSPSSFSAATPSTGLPTSEAPPFRPGPPAGPETLVAVAPPPRDPNTIQTSHTEPLPGDPRGPFPAQAQPAVAEPPGTTDPHAAFLNLMTAVQRKLEQGGQAGLLDVHRVLSQFCDSPGLSPEENRQLLDALYRVAGAVIYSRDPVLEPLYVVQPGENLVQIAERYRVPWSLLAHINGLPDPEHVPPGQRLKVVRGPFAALIRLDRCQMTLLLNDRFAGQFHIGLGLQPPPMEGTYQVVKKNNQWDEPAAGVPPVTNPADPQGRRIVLFNQMNQLTIQAALPPQIGRADGPGSIGLLPVDMDSAWDIFVPATPNAAGSQVVIQR